MNRKERRAAGRHLKKAAAEPGRAEEQEALSKACLAAGELIPATLAAQRALELRETPEIKGLFAQCIRQVRFTSENEALRKLLLRAVQEGWARPRDLAQVTISAIKLNSGARDLIARVNAAWPGRLPVEEMLATSGSTALARDPLLRALLESDLVSDLDLERVLTNVRHTMLAIRDAGEPLDKELLGFYCAAARQCFINQYIFAITPNEAEQASLLREALQQALATGAPYPVLWPVIVAAYFPLYRTTNGEALLARSWPGAVRDLIVQQIEEPLKEQRIAATIPELTSIGGDVSRAVRDQYEANPYPRWVKTGPPVPPAAQSDARATLTHNVLIAGCGTGLSTIELAQQARDAHILAIDLSLASLSYAKRMAQRFGVTNVEFAHADITQLGSVSRTFDFIDASGVLHHLADPWHGWRLLLERLRPGGTMQVGLYSELARQNVVAARALIAARGYQPTPDGIRLARQDIIASEDPLLKSVSQWEDFFSADECRDLLFHVQEHRIGLPEIGAFLDENGAQFSGFILDAGTMQRFAQRFPDRASMIDLACWHRFETEAPSTFAGMYNFLIRKS
jgi:2-polyprenyl-3-methyl-5-hydroxy-6-metoxy-1,4-benzoquinol methylase